MICAGFDQPYENAEIVLFGAPFDGTASFRPGARFAPPHIRESSYGLEEYSPYLDRSLAELKLHDAGDLPLFAASNDVEGVLKQIEAWVEQIMRDQKKPLMLGGDHLTSLPAIHAIHKKYPDLCVIQIDAHTDLADVFMGDRLSHASVMRRVWDFLGDGRIFQLGIRSGPKEEFSWAQKHTNLTKFLLKDISSEIGERPVYLTLDLDVLDPSVVSGTGTPEPGGLFFHDLLEGLYSLKSLNFVGADIVELAPHYDSSGASTIAAAKLLREITLILKVS